MELQVFSIRDKQLDAYMQPFYATTAGAAIRSFQDAVNDGSTPMNKHPEDYSLHQLAAWDDHTGAFKHFDTGPKLLAEADQLKTK